ncbi:MAG: chemotaxis protein CheB, partial [Actinoplanes sp.]
RTARLSLSPAANSTASGPLDALLISLADSFGGRAAAVVLSGMGRDSAMGAVALKNAGGTVMAQSEDSAEYAAMPRAAVEAGAVDLVLDLRDIGAVMVDVVRGGELPRTLGDRALAETLFAGPGEMPALMRGLDWRRTKLGSVSAWPDALLTVVQMALASPVGMCVLWGPDFLQRHLNEPLYARVLGGEAVSLVDARYPIARHGHVEDAWFDLTFSPIRNRDGRVGGVLATVIEKTGEVLSRRRLHLLNRLATGPAGAAMRRMPLERSMAALGGGERDIPFALTYLVDHSRSTAELAAAVGVEAGGPMAPHTISLAGDDAAWPVGRVVRTDDPVTVGRLAETFRGVMVGTNEIAAHTAVVFPLREYEDADSRIAGVVVLGLSASLPLDEGYREFLGLAAGQVAASLAAATVRQRQRDRIDRLAELDRVKTEFLSNLSHELRTPLTLVLAPLETLSAASAERPPALQSEVDVAARNARRMLLMVETLLDFSQIEALTAGANDYLVKPFARPGAHRPRRRPT